MDHKIKPQFDSVLTEIRIGYFEVGFTIITGTPFEPLLFQYTENR